MRMLVIVWVLTYHAQDLGLHPHPWGWGMGRSCTKIWQIYKTLFKMKSRYDNMLFWWKIRKPTCPVPQGSIPSLTTSVIDIEEAQNDKSEVTHENKATGQEQWINGSAVFRVFTALANDSIWFQEPMYTDSRLFDSPLPGELDPCGLYVHLHINTQIHVHIHTHNPQSLSLGILWPTHHWTIWARNSPLWLPWMWPDMVTMTLCGQKPLTTQTFTLRREQGLNENFKFSGFRVRDRSHFALRLT